MNKKYLIYSLPLVGALMFTGCATMFGGGGKQQIAFNSSKPMKAHLGYVADDNTSFSPLQSLTTPATVTVARDNKNLMLKSDDKEFEPVVIEKQTNSWFLGDVLALSLLSTTVDYLTGALWKYDETVTIPEK
jgi:hypothetical protein